jgi:hypothetical protein
MAQQREMYVKSIFINFDNNSRNERNINTIATDIIKRSQQDIVVGYCQIDTQQIQYNIGIRMLRNSLKRSANIDNDFQTLRNKNYQKENALGIEFGIGKRLPYQKLLFIPSINLSFYHSTSSHYELEEYYLNKTRALESHKVIDFAGGNFYSVAVNLSQGLYYQAGTHWKIGGTLDAAIGWRRIYGKTVQISRNLIDNTVSSPYITQDRNTNFFIQPSIQLGVRYTFSQKKNDK